MDLNPYNLFTIKDIDLHVDRNNRMRALFANPETDDIVELGAVFKSEDDQWTVWCTLDPEDTRLYAEATFTDDEGGFHAAQWFMVRTLRHFIEVARTDAGSRRIWKKA